MHVALQVLLVALELVLVPDGTAERAGARAEYLIEDPEREGAAVKHENHGKHGGEVSGALRHAVDEFATERRLPVVVPFLERWNEHEEVEGERRGESAGERRVDEQRERVRVPGHEGVEAEHAEPEQRVIRAPHHVTQRDGDRHVEASLVLRRSDHGAER